MFLHATGARAQVVPQPAPTLPFDSVVAASSRSGFRYVGRIRLRNAVTTATINATPFTAVVLVDTVLAAPSSVRPLGGRLVTLILRDTAGASLGAQFYFLASAVQFDTGTVLREEARFSMDPIGSLPGMQALMARSDSAILSRAIARRAIGSAAVVVGRVTAVDSTPLSLGPDGYRGEHRPGWRVATVRVGRQLRPVPPTLPVPGYMARVLFAGSRDVLFAFGPRLVVGDSVILILRTLNDIAPRLRPTGMDTTSLFTLLHPVDRQRPSVEALVAWAVR